MGVPPLDDNSFSDPLTESDVWMEEDLDSLTRGFSTKTDSPVYTRKITDPLGVSQHTKTKRKPSPGELEALVPNGRSTIITAQFSVVMLSLSVCVCVCVCRQ